MEQLLVQLQSLKKEQQEIKKLKLLESQNQVKFIQNFKRLLKIYKSKKQDNVMENLIQMNESIRTIANDVQGFKSIRHRLFLQASNDKDSNNKLYLYMFHLFESLVSNIAGLIQKSSQTLITQLPPELNMNQFNDQSTISLGKGEGFFAENLKSLIKSQQQIDEVIDHINKDQKRNAKLNNKRQKILEQFIKEFQSQSLNQSVDNSFEVKWSLQELENIVYEFVNAHSIPNEFNKDGDKLQDVQKEDIMKVQKNDQDKDGFLPQMVRDLILHDRGNSLFLSDSFANLPSPVNETQTIKHLFKPKEDQELQKKSQDDNEEFKFQKENRAKDIKVDGKDLDDSEEKPQVEIDLRELDKIVFSKDRTTKNDIFNYQDEDSYLNPTNLSCQVDNEEYVDQQIQSFMQTMAKNPTKMIEILNDSSLIESGSIQLNYNDINIAEYNNRGHKKQESSVTYGTQNQPSMIPFESDYLNKNPYAVQNLFNQNNNLSIKILDEQSSLISQSYDNQRQRQSNYNDCSEPSKPQVSVQNITNKEAFDYFTESEQLSQIHNQQSIESSNSELVISNQDVDENYKQNEEMEHSSCKNTVKMSERQDFSFFRDGAQLGRGVPQSVTNYDWNPNKSKSSNWNNQQDTVTRLNVPNTDQISVQSGKQQVRHNPFRVDIQTIRDMIDTPDEKAYQNNSQILDSIRERRASQQSNQSYKIKDPYVQKRDSIGVQQRSKSPLDYRAPQQFSKVEQTQQNIGRCASLKAFDPQAIPKNHGYNVQPMTNKHSVSTYDVSTERGMQTPVMGTNNRLTSYQDYSNQLSKDPSKKSLNSIKSKPKRDKSSQSGITTVRQSQYLKVIENKVEKTKQKNIDALKMVLGSYQSLDGRNYISAPSKSQVNQSVTINGNSLKDTERAYEFQSVSTNVVSAREPFKLKTTKKKRQQVETSRTSGNRGFSIKKQSVGGITKRDLSNLSALPQISRGGPTL